MDLEIDWIHLDDIPDETLSLGDEPGAFRPRAAALDAPEDGGLVLRLVRASVLRTDAHWLPGAASVWEVLACQERSRVVPGMHLFSHPCPPCGICPACLAGSHSLCLDSRSRPSRPGWFSRHRTLHPWAARRGTLVLPSHLDDRAASLLEPLARIVRLERLFPRRDRILAIGADLPSALAGMALEGPRRRVLLGSDPTFPADLAGFHAVVPDARGAHEALGTGADLVVLLDGGAESVDAALDSLAPGGEVAALVPWDDVPGFASRLRAKDARWSALDGTSPQDWTSAARRLPALSDRICSLPSARLPLEDSARAAELLARDASILRVELE